MKRGIAPATAAVAALTALAAVIRFAGIAHQSFWYDEAHTVWILHGSLPTMLGHLQTSEVTPPLYFLIAWPWVRVFGYGELALRSLSAVAGVATVPVVYVAARRLMSTRVGLLAAALSCCSPLLVWYAQEARTYALLILLTSVTWWALAHLRDAPSRPWAVVWAVAAGSAMATHYYAALVVVPQAIWLFVRYRAQRSVRISVESVVVWSLLLSVLAVKQLLFLGVGSNWINRVALGQRVGDLASGFALGPAAPLRPWLVSVTGFVVGYAGWQLVRAKHSERAAARLIARIAAGGTAMVCVLLFAGFDQLDTRNLIALWLPLALLVAGGLGTRRAGARGIAGVGILCGLSLVTVLAVAVDGNLQRPDWRGLAHALRAAPGRAIFSVNGCQLLPLSLYLQGLEFAPGGAAAREVDVVTAAGQASWKAVLFAGAYVTCRPQGAVTMPSRLGGFREQAGATRVGRFTVFRFRSPAPLPVNQRMFSAAGLHGALMAQADGGPGGAAGYSAP